MCNAWQRQVDSDPQSHVGGPADGQYSLETPANNPNNVVLNTAVRKMPNTGGPPYLAVVAMLLLAAAVMA